MAATLSELIQKGKTETIHYCSVLLKNLQVKKDLNISDVQKFTLYWKMMVQR